MKAYLNVYWDRLESFEYGAFLQFETPDGEKLEGILIEDVIPLECRDQAHDPVEAIEFVKLISYWLVPAAFIRKQMRRAKGRSEADPHEATLPPVDLAHFGMVVADGEPDRTRVRAIVSLIARFWHEKPELGLFERLFDSTDDLALIEKRLVAFYRYRDLPRDNDRLKLGQLLLPPECRDGSKILEDGQFETALRWLKRGGASGPTRQDNLTWNLNLRELGLVDVASGRLNETAAQTASDFIWEHRDDTPDFQRLKIHLARFQTAPIRSGAALHRKAEKNAAAAKLSRTRKQNKIKRKRGRRK